MLQQEEQCTAAPLRATTRSTYSVNVVIGIIRGIILDYPINFGEIKTTLSHICAKQYASLSLAEFEISRSTLLLLLFAVYVLDWNIDIVEKI